MLCSRKHCSCMKWSVLYKASTNQLHPREEVSVKTFFELSFLLLPWVCTFPEAAGGPAIGSWPWALLPHDFSRLLAFVFLKSFFIILRISKEKDNHIMFYCDFRIILQMWIKRRASGFPDPEGSWPGSSLGTLLGEMAKASSSVSPGKPLLLPEAWSLSPERTAAASGDVVDGCEQWALWSGPR